LSTNAHTAHFPATWGSLKLSFEFLQPWVKAGCDENAQRPAKPECHARKSHAVFPFKHTLPFSKNHSEFVWREWSAGAGQGSASETCRHPFLLQ